MPVDRKNFLATVELGVPIETAAAAVGWTREDLQSLRMHDKELMHKVAMYSARAEIDLYTKMMDSGKADWRCVQQTLERMHPEKYARPEVQAQLTPKPWSRRCRSGSQLQSSATVASLLVRLVETY
jgi:hypothetical protein